MTKKIMNDIIVNKKSIRQVSLSKEKLEKKNLEKNSPDLNPEPIRRNRKKNNWQRKGMNPKFAIWSIAIICLASLFFGISIIFSSATIYVTPKSEKINFDEETYIAERSSSKENNLIFEIINTKKSLSSIIEAGEEKEVNQKASGKIIIYNNFDSNSQRLINNTRFESTDGRIYRINNSVIVPGMKKVDGKDIPGSIEVIVYADQAGESYNLKLADLKGDFTIPGFKGDPRYTKFYARLKEDIQGGFIGKQRIVSDNLREETVESLKLKLKEELLKEIYAIKPSDYILFPDHYSILYSNLPDTSIDNNKVKIEIEGNIYVIVFDDLKLSKHISQKKGLNAEGNPTKFIASDDFTISIIQNEKTDIITDKNLNLKLNGEATIKWVYDTLELKRELAGKKEIDLKKVLLNYSNSISNMSVVFRPVWSRYIPDNLAKIKIKEK